MHYRAKTAARKAPKKVPTPASRVAPAPVALVVPEEVGEGELEGLGLPEPVGVAGIEAKERDLGLGVAVEVADKDAIGQFRF